MLRRSAEAAEAPPAHDQQPWATSPPYADAALALFILSCATALYQWRYDTIPATLMTLFFAFLCAPDHIAAKTYKYLMELPDRTILSFRTPPDWFVFGVTYPVRRLFPVKVRGIENVPSSAANERLLFVCNHQMWGLDVGLKWPTIYEKTGLYLRAVTDRSHNHIPLFKHLIVYTGGVPGTREATQALMDRGLPLLIYPGGANEVWKSADDDPYALDWKDRLGFVRMAVENGYKIVPFASVGVADAVRILFTIPARWLWAAIGDKRMKKPKKEAAAASVADGGDTFNERSPQPQAAPPSPPTSPSKMGEGIPVLDPTYLVPQSNYLVFREPIDARSFIASYDAGDEERALFALRDAVRSSVEDSVAEALRWREQDPGRFTFGEDGLFAWLVGGVSQKKVKSE